MIRVNLIAYTKATGGNDIVEFVNASAANLCYNEVGAKDIMNDMTEDKARSLTKMMIDNGHTSTIEHVSFTFAIEGISRACTHQLIRHRIASYSQQSQRYVKSNNFRRTLIKPESIAKDKRASAIFDYGMDVVSECYNELLELKIPAEDARFMLPNAAETKIVVTMNARTLLHFFEERCCNRAQWEIRQLATQMLAECKKVAPILFASAGASCETRGVCKEGKFTCGRLKRKVGKTNES